jgi:hypothetical protein
MQKPLPNGSLIVTMRPQSKAELHLRLRSGAQRPLEGGPEIRHDEVEVDGVHFLVSPHEMLGVSAHR